jgi:coenzyme F420-0:L-glutamate ligase / coenzyme F420-1:gamma-L-glutamate ligase
MTEPQPSETPARLVLRSLSWPEVEVGDDLAGLVCSVPHLADGDVVVVTSKVVSKAEGRSSGGERGAAVDAETRRVVARRGTTVIAETRHGFVLAAAGVDASNVAAGVLLSLPVDPDSTARSLRAQVHARIDVNVAVVITDTAGRAWRNGQVDLAIGCAGIAALIDLQGRPDTHGRPLLVTERAIADEIASAADLVKGKLTGRPVAVVSGFSDFVLPPGAHGPGAAALVRDHDSDMFGLGARDAVEVAVRRDSPADLAHFPRHVETDPDPFAALDCADPDVRIEVRRHLDAVGAGWAVEITLREGAGQQAWLAAGRAAERAEILAAGHRLHSVQPAPDHAQDTGWRAVVRRTWIVA